MSCRQAPQSSLSMRSMPTTEATNQRVAIDAGTALEHLTKTCLVSRSPALLTELKPGPNNWASLLLLCGFSEGRPKQLRTVGPLPPGHTDLPADLSEVGQPVLVPGSMGTASYVLAGVRPGGAFFDMRVGGPRPAHCASTAGGCRQGLSLWLPALATAYCRIPQTRESRHGHRRAPVMLKPPYALLSRRSPIFAIRASAGGASQSSKRSTPSTRRCTSTKVTMSSLLHPRRRTCLHSRCHGVPGRPGDLVFGPEECHAHRVHFPGRASAAGRPWSCG
jgi:hypothetical protein